MERYVPALGRPGLTRGYDALMAATMRERRWRPRLVASVMEAQPRLVIDVGAGTGTTAIAIAARGAAVVAVDGDEEALDLARRKPGAEAVRWRHGFAGALPVADGEADAVVMSLVLHHLTPEAQVAALRDARRALREQGRLHVADWGKPRGVLARAGFALLRALDGRENTRPHAEGRLPEAIMQAGFQRPRLQGRVGTPWGTLELLEAGVLSASSPG